MMIFMVQIHCPCMGIFIIFDIKIDPANSCFGEDLFYLYAEFFFGCHDRRLHYLDMTAQ